MKLGADRIRSLIDAFTSLLERESGASREVISSLLETIQVLQGGSSDRRLQRMAAQLKGLEERLDLLDRMARQDFLDAIRREAERLAENKADIRASRVMTSLARIPAPSVKLFCERLLDSLIETTGAERGFVLFYLPESSEADCIAARNFQTRNLSLEEYSFSRSLLREVFERGEPLLLDDASADSRFATQMSIVRLDLKSVLAAPLKQSGRTVGALYLENNHLARAFDEDDLQLIESLAEFTVFYLSHARVLPVVFETDTKLFLDSSKAAREIIGKSPKILALLDMVDRIADSPATVLIEGESGTGKELVARSLHYRSARRQCPFIAINCAAIPENLLESELFGYEKGAFTGATARYTGQIEQASRGTIFLDEVSELAYPLQAKLLRFLQSGEFRRLGGKTTVKADARVVAATSKDLKAMIAEGKFQEALYYRLNVIPVLLPPLRQRREDIPLLADHFFDKFCAMYGRELFVEPEVYERLSEYDFPGNVREMENLIHRLVALASGNSIRIGDLPSEILQMASRRISLEQDPLFQLLHTPPADLEDLRNRKEQIKRVVAEQERRLAERVIEESDGNLTEAARRLGMHRITLHNMVKGNKKTKR
ncbi:MAG: sigma-54-dependent Fis family transcriptional regulator [Acidobacteriota bacterium]